MDKLLTVVIPSYNVEKFLNQTLDSFICDEAVMKKFEVIVVDDGSKDNSECIGVLIGVLLAYFCGVIL